MEILEGNSEGRLFYANDITVRFGGLTALNNVSLQIAENEIKGLIGPNGAGKTTFFNAITGYVYKESGDILFQGKNITKFKTHEIAELGIIRTFQKRGIVPHLTALENVLIGYHRMMNDVKLWNIVFKTRKYNVEEAKAIQVAKEALESVGMSGTSDLRAGALSFGQQTLIEIARAIVSMPKLLLLDEPGAGLSSSEREHLIWVLRTLSTKQGIPMIITDHVMDFLMEICEYLTVLNFGEVLAEGNPTYIRQHKGVLKAYLGVED